MKIREIINYSFVGLRHRKMRLWLTILGVVIGIASVVALLTLGQAFNAEVNKQLSTLNGNTIYVLPISEKALHSAGASPTMSYSSKLTEKDVDRLRRIPEITDISRLIERRASVEFKGKKLTTTIDGIEPAVFQKVSSIEVAEGRFLQDTDRHSLGIGGQTAEDLFGADKPVSVNSYIIINGVDYRVIGILKKTGGGFGSDLDNGIFVNYQDAQEIFKNTIGKDEMDAIAVSVSEGADLKEVAESMKVELDASHKVRPDERDYSVIDPEFIQQSIGTVLSLITLFLGAIAGISLIVGGLAISTSMFTSVIERTQEIGVLKAVGASNSVILAIFLFEAGALGLAGGIIGTALGLLLVFIGGLFGLPVSVDFGIAAFGIIFAFVVGVLSGFFPAQRAARLSPVEAFRYDK
jgi:putative ABC transport system permease protein